MTTLKKGDPAPWFEGVGQEGQKVTLADFRGKKLILYFYPKDNTPGCTAEACNLNDHYSTWLERGFEVVGISPDSTTSHRNFITKNGLRFTLLSDPDHVIMEHYGVWKEKKMYGKSYMGVLRTTFVIDPEGVITEVISSVDTKNHTVQIEKTLNL